MKRKIAKIVAAVIFLCGCSGYAQNTALEQALGNADSSVNFALKLKAGWNLGNTLDAYDNKNEAGFSLQAETCWGMPYTTKEMIKAVHEAGFSTIRIPVSWHGHLSNDPEDPYKIDAAWMKRVQQVVDYAYNEGLYVILNVHHDNLSVSAGNGAGTINSLGYNNYKLLGYAVDSAFKRQSKFYLRNVWEQIAAVFNNDYDEHLIFEVLNEPRNVGGSDEWNANQNGKQAEYNKLLLDYEQTCVDVIRASGGKNANRYVMVPGYAASPLYFDGFELPKDSASDKLLISFHAYTPYEFAMWADYKEDSVFDKGDMGTIDWAFEAVREKFPDVGVVLGETSAENKNNLSERIKWAEYFFGNAYKKYKYAVVLWDNNVPTPDSNHNGEHHGYFNRDRLEWYFPEMTQAFVNACK